MGGHGTLSGKEGSSGNALQRAASSFYRLLPGTTSKSSSRKPPQASASAVAPAPKQQASKPIPIAANANNISVLQRDSLRRGSMNAPAEPEQTEDFGFLHGLEDRFELLSELGRGGNGVVHLARCKMSGKEFACKSMPKVLRDPKMSDKKKAGWGEAIRTEVDVLRRLRGTLNVASLVEVFEDDEHVHIVMEACKGGELWHRIGERHYSERTVASYMRAVLRTLAQCHSHHILHRDIKPGNFMLLSEDDKAPLKAIDFGLAVPFTPDKLPRSDLGLEGTPWFMAPEVLSSAVVPASDLWSAGVMAHQLLTGRFPFDDKRSPFNPSITRIWQSILGDKLDLKRSYWAGISPEAQDFVASLLHKDPKQRPTAKQALRHPWLRGDVQDRSTGKQLSVSVVQRIQRFGSSSMFKRTVLEHIAADLLATRLAPANPDVCAIGAGARPVLTEPSDHPLQYLYKSLDFDDADVVDRHTLSEGLRRLGYRLEADEVEKLMDQLDIGNTGQVAKLQFAASQIDWRALQELHVERWLESARRVFADFDTDGDGVIQHEDILGCLRAKLPPDEVDIAVRHAMAEACKNDDSIRAGLNFDQFLHMLRSDSRDSLDQYDDRMSTTPGSHDRLNSLLEKSCRGGDLYARAAHLDPVMEVS